MTVGHGSRNCQSAIKTYKNMTSVGHAALGRHHTLDCGRVLLLLGPVHGQDPVLSHALSRSDFGLGHAAVTSSCRPLRLLIKEQQRNARMHSSEKKGTLSCVPHSRAHQQS